MSSNFKMGKDQEEVDEGKWVENNQQIQVQKREGASIVVVEMVDRNLKTTKELTT